MMRSAVSVAAAGLLACVFACSPRPQPIAFAPDPLPLMRRVADRVLQDHPKPPSMNWGEGVMLAGVLDAAEVTGEASYLAFARNWADSWRDRLDGQLDGREEHLRKEGYCGVWGPGLALTMLYEKTGNRTYLEMAGQIAGFIRTEATRTSDDALGHWRGNYQLWVDTLYMACPVLTRFGRLTGNQADINEAGEQIVTFARHLQDDETGLFFHMYDEPLKHRSGERWARGNGWAAMSCMEVLKPAGRMATSTPEVRRIFDLLVRGLLLTRDPGSGLWHTVLDRPDTPIETSAGAMILHAMLQARRYNIGAAIDPAVLSESWSSLAARVDADGHFTGVSTGTGPTNTETYAKIQTGTFPWGTGAFLMAARSVAEAR